MKLSAIILLLCLMVSCAQAQNSLPVMFDGAPARKASVASFTRGTTLYASLTDLARLLHLQTTIDPASHKLEIRGKNYTLRIAGENPFVVIFDENHSGSVFQLQHAVVISSNSYFVPVKEFTIIFDDVLPEDIHFDAVHRQMIVGKPAAPSPFDISGLVFEEKSNGYLLRIRCTKKLSDYESWIKSDGDNSWVYMTLANARADVAVLNRTPLTSALKKVLVFQSPKSVQLTIKVKGPVSSTEMIPAEGNNDLLLSIHTPSEEQIAARNVRNYETQLERERDRWKLDVVVIDAGHGGDDPGTIGVTRTKEKDVTLGIALKLGKLIAKQLPGVRVVYTRKTDEFIELYRRGQIANQASGKLFISIHCNAMPHKPHPLNGYEIYLLRPGKTENAVRLAEQENASVKFEQGYEKHYQQLTEENFILLTMAQNAYVKYSEKFADLLQQEMGKHTGLESNGIKQAGFYVLVGASMPNVLIETAYLSNKHDEKILKSTAGQQRIAESVLRAVKRYKREYEKALQEGKDTGAGSR
jgi:N-acetylmuramoyl-L-alanine amidase